MVSVTSLQKCYQESVVLRDISFSVEEGEVFGIVGHSGAGKSTLLRCLNGLEGYDSGSVHVMGREVGDLDPAGIRLLRRDMGMIFQTFNLLSSLSVLENVLLPLRLWHVPAAEREARAGELLRLVGLYERRFERVSALSGGQKQRVGIARALALSPKVLLCDEATSALDPGTTISILDLLLDIRTSLGLTIVFVTHQMEAVKRACDRIMLLDGGQIQGTGPTDRFFLAPSEDLRRLVQDEYAQFPGGTNIRLWFPREIARDAVITSMARALDVDFAIVGGKLERYADDVRGFLVINVPDPDRERVLAYLEAKKLYWEVLGNE
ncbi:methionine ABC transporter ATP-binding protein [Phaeovibrio sulfidiphilus]|uniref:Methionine ABC transporter ATP-binding protein n=1 Tax=Phaeovibrio sulfidiphilus TaxID=1220600 RepID=A0A8J6YK08_9PROT|nr:methionine ABC transporter ATP-binding protein [Phaeovibrio sulfidiphilus]